MNQKEIQMEKMRGSANRWMAAFASVVAAMTLAACGGGGGGGGAVPQGTVKMTMTDQPACYRSVLVTVEKVRVHKGDTAGDSDGGWEDILPPGGPTQVDLLHLTNGALVDLGAAEVDSGAYSQVRLVLAENASSPPYANSVTLLDGTVMPLKTPSAQQSGLKIKGDFRVLPNDTTEMLLDFDACKSVVVAGNSGQYILKPVVRLSQKVNTSIQGYVTTTMTLSATSVSAQQNGTVVRSTVPDSTGKFVLAYLPGGTYTVVITSDERATGVINSVPVSLSAPTTRVNGTATAIVLPTSVMNTVTGVVTASTGSDPTVGDAFVTATQNLTTGKIEVLSVPVDFDLATYTMKLPAAAPVRAPYATSGLVFTTDTAAAGKYTLTATAPGRAALTRSVDITGAPTTTTNFNY
jgi:hypothetical protein